MTKRRKRPNLFSWTVLGLVLLFGYYLNQVYLPSQPNPFEATPTVTRSPESYATEAEQLFQQGKLLQSIDAFESAVKASPQNPSLYISLARVQVFAGQYEEAKANAENAMLLNPESSMAHAVRGWALDFLGENSEALDEVDRALELDPNNAIAHAYRVEILIDSESFDNIALAADVSRKALALDPNALETRRARAYLLEATANYEEAIQFYRSAIEVNPNIPILRMELGRNLRFLQVYEDAIKEFTLANTLNPPDPEPDLFISRTYATMGDYAKALQYAETAVKDRPTDASLHGNWGVMFYRNFFYEESARELGIVVNGGQTEDGFPIRAIPLSNDVRIVEYYFTYALALARTNQCGKALQITQEIQSKVRLDEVTMEIVNDAITRTIEICQENLDNPPADTPEFPTEEAAETETETPEVSPTATP
ncbi:MAG TPA: tetratricopeptide repeat protein [Anaerolineales bacterium]|nr:tetratricopeptide repeat protein [Anaerolineales bacterium]